MREFSLIENNSIPITESGCWWWLGNLTVNGYGSIRLGAANVRAHRLSWIIYRGVIAGGLNVLHRCDTRCCVNPDHLFLGTQADNMRDMVAKGRSSRGGGAKPKLTKEQQAAAAAWPESLRLTALKFGVSKATLVTIRARARKAKELADG